MITAAAVLVASYLIGALPFSYIAGRVVKGIDLREHGSGNLGATNTFRMLGAKWAVPVLILDVAKGFLPVFLAGHLALPGSVAGPWLRLAAMFGAILGHLFSPYVRFSGGKGIATSAGAFMALAPWGFLGAFLTFAATFAARRIVSLASLAAAITLPLWVYAAGRTGLSESHWSILVVSSIMMGIIVIKHRSNIRRLLAGTEKPIMSSRKDLA
jgi:glycerol-3-phosphate acyltransferase PlsY